MVDIVRIASDLGFIAGGIVCGLLYRPVETFTKSEVVLITKKIEAIKVSDVSLYNRLMTEWEKLSQQRKVQIQTEATSELASILKAVKLKI